EAAELEIDDDDEWEVDLDTSAEAVARRQKALAGNFTQGDEDEGAEDPYDLLGDYINTKPESDLDIFNKAKELNLYKKHRALVVVVQCLFTDPATIVKDVAKHATLLRSFGDSDKHQRAVLGGFERVISESLDALLPKVQPILMALYNADVVEEEAFLEWGKKPSKKYVEKD
ncbi:eukaryotic translation initiation factor 5, partial [Linderina pennispora]